MKASNDVKLEYWARLLDDGDVNVGTIYLPK